VISAKFGLECLTDQLGVPLARKIDENRSLPYKPRQLSAMARFDRGRLV
jgi:hypothetical protein